MLTNIMVDAAMAEFKQNLSNFCEPLDCSALTPALAERVSAGLLQAFSAAGVASFRAFLQAYEAKDDVVRDAQGGVFRFKKKRNRDFMTPFGKLSIERRCYQNKSDTKSYVPLDAAWGMEGHYMTPEVREAVLFCCALTTPAETVQIVHKCALFKPDATTIKREVERTGSLIQRHREALDEAVRAKEQSPEGTRALVVSADGATVLMNEKGLRFGRPAERPRGEKPNETPTAYRIAMVGCVSHYGPPNASGHGPERLQSKYVAHMPEPYCPTFKTLLEAEVDAAEARMPAEAARILLLDGARDLWHYFENDPRYGGYHRCIDFWHAAEHLSVAAEALFGSGAAAKRWYEKYYRILLESDDGATRIGRSIDHYDSKNKRSKTSQKHLREQRTYFKRNAKRMPYKTFRDNGWPIGSGPIEAACKTLIKQRLCRSGMRWTRKGGQHVLALRTYVKSNRWENAWQHIKALNNAA